MKWETVRTYCAQRPGATEELPFGPDVLVFKVGGKMFALLNFQQPAGLSLKCDPLRAQVLRATYAAIAPGYHLNKQHWNTLMLDGSLAAELIYELVNHSYDLVVAKLPKAVRATLQQHDEL